MIDIKVPAVGESINEVTLVKWLKKDGEWVDRDELLCELESEKATFELNAEQAGMLKIVAQEGATLNIGDLACQIDETAARPEGAQAAKADAKPAEKKEEKAPAKTEATKAAPVASDVKATPVAKSIMAEKQVNPAQVKGSGSLGKILKQDVLEALSNPGRKGGADAFSRNDRREK
jgi:2-oxoglutarate dehydrogenase E2 component (dihydrolipoamide succinyltransferase)